MTLVDRVARAIYESEWGRPQPGIPRAWDDLNEAQKNYWRGNARPAITTTLNYLGENGTIIVLPPAECRAMADEEESA